ncbi:MBL fold metallo-hydrolase [Geobacter sp. SVR]|uniref:MBL fold metallo-hydrolase n=1 Tax=Geobacter sp. SVR TaxID=2495594 RepID=UPI00143EFCEB|nr:MBL fold metallo-hydrolase [Geobacter sp. SVR]BCS56012.1 MBL fold metallo-hydrolase [Geobacter sp. SVR]GCF84775.1 MBL fold metallo-hydrolase [Geobacter sp. SVR]
MIFEIVVVGPLAVNCYLLGCEETGEGLIVDAGGDADRIIAAVNKHGLRIGQIINTHGHFDHVGANRALLDHFGARLLIHGADAPMLDRAADVARAYGMSGENSPKPDALLEDGLQLAFGNCRLTVLHTPGHTQGGCCLYLADQKKVITGDTLFADSIGRTDLPGGSHAMLLESIRSKLFTLPDDVDAYPGHGPATTIGHEKQHNPYF